TANAELVRTAVLHASRCEQGWRSWLLPDLADTVDRAERASLHLWCRRPRDVDTGLVMVGLGEVAWRPRLATGDDSSWPSGHDLDAVANLGPTRVGVTLGPGETVGVCGCRGPATALARSMLLQAAVHHGPADLSIAVI